MSEDQIITELRRRVDIAIDAVKSGDQLAPFYLGDVSTMANVMQKKIRRDGTLSEALDNE